MTIVDFILNLAGLLLWLNWRSVRFDPLAKRTPATLMGTLRPAAPQKLRPWHLPVFLVVLLFLRALIYWWIGSSFTQVWVAKLDLGAVILPFRSDWFLRIVFFSFFSFGVALGFLYLTLLFLSLLQGPEPFHRLVKIPLGKMDDWPPVVKIVLPFIATVIFWLLASWLFVWLQVMPRPVSVAHRIEEAIVIALGSYLVWTFPAAIILLLHLLNSYVYFGRHPFWNYLNATAQKILSPLKRVPLQIGKVDFAPVVVLALIFLASESVSYGLWRLYARLPF